ncbi:rhomboid family intramembrane serine protease [Niastella koreensis]|uniref:Rhomboid family protein n=2 Tax=Niastella koreensis TaxID=354356 RepID=G8TDG2_NIAKG|nr:rhomboid family intramembrane serine protease [Niastella koreensis]AEW00412.1 Rhomboid family protein [Niastella koreensis GR20-10]OQP52278.1 rhomboid family intramembrane serine protease [Niastella koreensis]
MSITLIIIIITVLVSITAFSNDKVFNDFIFDPPAVTYNKQWWRFLTCGLIHADYGHLIFNMYALYMFGEYVEHSFIQVFQEKGKLLYLVLYITALFACLVPTYLKHRADNYYRSLGASGAVSAVIFAFIILNPLDKMGLLFLPLRIPSFIFGFLYLVISSFLDKRGGGGINHSAHIFGALYGIAFLIFTGYVFSDYPVLAAFIQQIRTYIGY